MTNDLALARPHRLTAELAERIDGAVARALDEDWVSRLWARDAVALDRRRTRRRG